MSKSLDEKNLTRRYLVWCYKTTKEDFDKIERRFTQLKVDYFLRDYYKGLKKDDRSDLAQHLEDFNVYIANKEEKGISDKFEDAKGRVLKKEFLYLKFRLQAIEKAIIHFLGSKALKDIKDFYEAEMTNRILQAREHS